MGTLRARGKRWQAQVIRAGHPLQARTFDKKTEARNWMKAVEAAMSAGTFVGVKASTTQVRELIDKFIETEEMMEAVEAPERAGSARAKRKPASKLRPKPALRREWNRLQHLREAFGAYDPRYITGDLLERYKQERAKQGNQAPTIRKNLYTLQKILKWARQRRYIGKGPKIADLIKMPGSGVQRERRLELGEEAALWRAIAPDAKKMPIFKDYIEAADVSLALKVDEETRQRLEVRGKGKKLGAIKSPLRRNNEALGCVVLLALETACRLGEILTLRWEYVDLPGRSLHLPVTKGGRPRNVPLTSFALRCLEELRQIKEKEDEALPRGDPRRIHGLYPPYYRGGVFTWKNTDAFERRWRGVVLAAGLENFHFHDLRHEAISRIFERTKLSDTEIASIAGHTSTDMLLRYLKLRGSNLAKKLW